MSFDWMQTTTANGQSSGASARRTEVLSDEIRERAGLFRRLGYPRAHAVHRCLGNIAWAYSEAGKPPISAAEVRRIVDDVYRR